MDLKQKMTLFFEGDDYFDAALEVCRQAQTEILLEFYIFDLDRVGFDLLAALRDQRQKGVRVCLLIDGVGSLSWISSLQAWCDNHDIEFRVFHPLPFRQQLLRRNLWQYVQHFSEFFRTVNKRNHRKMILVDNQVAFTGSFNVSQVHSRKIRGESRWRDTGIKVENLKSNHLRESFFEIWYKSSADRRFPFKDRKRSVGRSKLSSFLRLNHRFELRYSLLRDLNRKIKRAKSRVLITNAYFLPNRSILRSLAQASKNGAYVALCLPAKTDVKAVRWASRVIYRYLLKNGIYIYEYQPRVLHAKSLIIDEFAVVGSMNLNHRSLIHDLEIEVGFRDPQLVQQLLEHWDLDIHSSSPVTSHDLDSVPFWEKWLSVFFFWFRYWL